MRFWYLLCFTPMLGFANTSLTEEQYTNLLQQLQRYPIDTEKLLESASQSSADEPLSILRNAQLIKFLRSKEQLTAQEQNWLKLRASDTHQLFLRDSDHPEKDITLYDIANLASSTLQFFEDKIGASELLSKWRKQGFETSDFESLANEEKQQTFSMLLEEMAPVEAMGMVDQLLELWRAQADDLRFAALAQKLSVKTGNIELSEFLVSRPVNQYSTAFIQQIPELFAEEQALSLLQRASEVKEQASQSIFVIVKRYPDSPDAANFVAQQLVSSENYWHALMVLPAFVKVGNVDAFHRVLPQLPQAYQQQVLTRLEAN
ncbi:MAG: hypothetical protein GJ680_16770 [Alteromonadaceae bacterium]|nr:hypothetical protein [Alteromonadaceae bacterium]